MKAHVLATCLVIAAMVAAGGCVKRTLLLKTDPPGAEAFIDDVHVGATPVIHTFYHYGEKEVRLQKDGYETHSDVVNLKPPKYEQFPFDFFSDVLWPETFFDRHEATFALTPMRPVDEEKLMERANDMRTDMIQQTGGPSPEEEK